MYFFEVSISTGFWDGFGKVWGSPNPQFLHFVRDLFDKKTYCFLHRFLLHFWNVLKALGPQNGPQSDENGRPSLAKFDVGSIFVATIKFPFDLARFGQGFERV